VTFAVPSANVATWRKVTFGEVSLDRDTAFGAARPTVRFWGAKADSRERPAYDPEQAFGGRSVVDCFAHLCGIRNHDRLA
jgi:hypothetical protein